MSARRRQPPGCGGQRRGNSKPRTFAQVVEKYIAEDQQRGDEGLKWFATRPDFETALECAVMSRTCKNKRHRHQCRIPERKLQQALRALRKCDLEACDSFEALHDRIEETAGAIDGIGPLAVYDFALRIGAHLKLRPRHVYLHSGTRKGANALGLGHGCKSIKVKELPAEFHCLSARHAEDCLCIYKDDLKRIHGTR